MDAQKADAPKASPPSTAQAKIVPSKIKKKKDALPGDILFHGIEQPTQSDVADSAVIDSKPLKKHQWELIANLSKKLIKKVDKDIYEVKEFVKPQAT